MSSKSPRGLQESNGRAVISALKTLQDKIRSMERAKHEKESSLASPKSVTESVGTNTPREMTRKVARSASICGSDSGSVYSNTNLVQIAPSSRSRELERELSLADERCRLLEERLNTMRQNYARAESDRNQEFEARLRLERNSTLATPLQLPIPSCRSPTITNDENLELDEINLKFRLSPRTDNDENNSVDNFNEKLKQLELDNDDEFEVVESVKKNDKINVKVQKKKIPFCAGKSATPSHNVGLNIQGLMHQLKTKNQNRPRSATTTPVTTSSLKLTDEIDNLRKLLNDLQAEFGEITLSCRRSDLDVDALQDRLRSLEKKGQQILVIKKLLKKKEDKLRNEKSSTSSDGTISSKQPIRRGTGELRSRQNRLLLREVKKIKNQI